MKKPFYQENIVNICDNKHLTVDEIFYLLKKNYPSVWRATVYRNVEELVKTWYLNKISSAGSKALFEKNKWFHAHILDEKTWKIMDIELDIENISKYLPDDFVLKNIEVVIKGESKTSEKWIMNREK